MKEYNYVFFLVLVFLLTGCKFNEYSPVSDSKLLTKLVYNTCIAENENYSMIDYNNNARFSNNFSFSSLEIVESFAFKTSFDFVMDPYFNNYAIGDEIDVVIALLELKDNIGAQAYTRMIIFSYNNDIVGFVSSSMVIGKFSDIPYEFESCNFLTSNEVIKYYENDEKMYCFTYNQNNNGQFELLVTTNIIGSQENWMQLNSTILKDSFIELCNNEIIDLINLSYIEKIEVEATITGFMDDSRRIYVESENKVTLKSVSYNFEIVDKNGNIYNHSDLKIGDKIIIYYYQRYKTYEPVNISVDNIYLKV